MTARVEAGALVLQLEERKEENVRGAVLRFVFEGASERVEIVGEEEVPTLWNYILGNDPGRWRVGVKGYARVRYRGLYEGVDLVVRERGRDLEYDLYLAPVADLSKAVVRVEGARGPIHLDEEGDLVLETSLGGVRLPRPKAWQECGEREEEVDCEYRVLSEDRFALSAPAWRHAGRLVIDPGLVYSTFLGGNNHDTPLAVAVDATGASVVTGSTQSSGFPSTAGSFDTTFNGFSDVFVARLSPSGSSLTYSTFLGGVFDEEAWAIALDATGQPTVTGWTESTDFPTTAGVVGTTFSGGFTDGFVARLSVSGSALVYSTFLGGTATDVTRAIRIDAAGTTVVGGTTLSADFPTTPAALQPGFAGGFSDAFLTAFNPSATGIVYSTFLGGGASEEVFALAVDAGGSATAVGYTSSSGFPTTPSAFQPIFNGGPSDAFVARISPSGDSLVYSTFLGGTSWEDAMGLALDALGVTFVSGYTSSTDFPTTPGAFDSSFNGPPGITDDVFVASLSPGGSSLLYATFLGGDSYDEARGLGIDGSGAVTVAGFTWSRDFPTTTGAYDTSFDGPVCDFFVSRLSPTLDSLRYSTFLGGSGSESIPGMTVDPAAEATVIGQANYGGFPVTPGAFDTSHNGGWDGFVARLDLLPTGATAYGTSTAGCAGALPIGVTSIPQVGNAAFAITCGHAPATAAGFFGVSSGGLATPILLGSLAVWIDPLAPVFFEIIVPSNTIGASTVPIPIPAVPALAGAQAFFQFAWPDVCAPGGISASNALEIVVQP